MNYRPAHVDVGALLERLGIKAEKRGDSWWACCPFHEEKTPSWRMRDRSGDDKHGKHVCFGCDEGGSHVWLVMRMLGLERPREAWLWIQNGDRAPEERRTGLVVDVAERKDEKRFRLPYGSIVDEPLREWPERFADYARKRSIESWQVERWRLGYALEGRLRRRIVIPIRDADNQLVSYTARAISSAMDRKYLEPREEEGASKAAIFGEQLWHDCHQECVIVCEGSLNGLAIERALQPMVPAIAALNGSHFDRAHADKLAQFPNVVIASDPDAAGEKMRRALQSISRWTKLCHARFPGKMDACDVERELGRGELRKLLEEARS